jgi:hypothetical protein
MSQAFNLVSGPEINELLAAPNNRIQQMIGAGKSNRDLITELYWAALSRPPTQAEMLETTARADKAEDRRKAFEDLSWALLNAKEFVFRP